MSLWETLLIILGIVLSGLVLSFGIIYLINRNHKKSAFSPQKSSSVNSGKKSTTATLSLRTSARSKEVKGEDPLEVLLKNHKKAEPNNFLIQSTVTRPSPAISGTLIDKTRPVGVLQLAAESNKQEEIKQKSTRVQKISMESPNSQNKPQPSRNSGNSAKEDVSIKNVIEKTATTGTSIPASERGEIRVNTIKLESLTEKIKFPKSKVYQELKSNFKIATVPWAGKLVPFHAISWDGEQDHLESEFANQNYEISEVYIDIRLANSIVWLSNEVGRKSPELDEGYRQLCSKIAERIEKVLSSVNSKALD